MATQQLNEYVRRYTTLSSALETFAKKKLVLLSPSKWDDTNDVFFMEIYKDHIQAKSVLALCFTMATETYHHWKVFTQGIEGICIEFNRQDLSGGLNRLINVVAEPVDYITIDELTRLGPTQIDKLPFVKRLGYRDEREWRIIAKSSKENQEYFDVNIDLSWINRVIFNPWMPPSLADNLRSVIKSIPECSKLTIESSRLTNSKAWKKAGKSLAELIIK